MEVLGSGDRIAVDSTLRRSRFGCGRDEQLSFRVLSLWFLWDTQGKVSIRQLNLWVWNSRETFRLEMETWSP